MVSLRREGGFSYLIVLFLAAALSIAAARAMEHTLTAERRDKEAETLWRGSAYREAIRLYYENSPGTVKHYPKELGDLLWDERLVRPSRPLRRLYTDPMSGGPWGVVRNKGGDLIGVVPQSAGAPLKRAGFPDTLASFASARHYSDWKFTYEPK